VKVTATDHAEVLLIEPHTFRDPNGFLMETFHAGKFRLRGAGNLVQDNHSRSVRGGAARPALMLSTRRKAVRVVTGEVLDVAVDIRKGSLFSAPGRCVVRREPETNVYPAGLRAWLLRVKRAGGCVV
jgi:dTDP-4-dehydrorhamnose 3,5-epimerase-like enzyme